MPSDSLLPSLLTRMVDCQLEKAFAASPQELRRLFHGRSGVIPQWSQVIVDWLPNVIVIRLYAQINQELLAALIAFTASKEAVKGVLVQKRGRGRETEFDIVYGEVPALLICEENGLKFEIEPLQNQNFGLFLDMRHGRQWLREHAQDKKILNLFAYTCAFSVAAVAGGAQLVANVDVSKKALSVGRRNHQLNGHQKQLTQFMPYDMLKSWSRIKKPGPFDIVVIDPPSFQPGSFVAQNDYAKVLRRLDQLTSDNALVMACHNDPAHTSDFVKDLMAQMCPEFEFEQRLAVPEEFYEDNSEKSLKVMIYKKRVNTA
ncbi:class I SAM-dependent methyltransferase [Gammaproteobacteria bacterium AS21]